MEKDTNAIFSIIIPVYNVEPYLRECLNSIINQTFQEFEIICIDDGSTDNSFSVLQEYAQKDKRFKIFRQENQGSGIARNYGINTAKGKYLVFVDPDDWVVQDYLEQLYDAFKESGADVELCNVSEVTDVSGYDVVLMGCPAMGAEELEPDEFEPFFEANGCEVTNHDYGVEEFEVIKVSDGPIKKKRI